VNQLDLATCIEHGWFAHVGIHEAGHATAAIVLDFDFIDVSINASKNVFFQMAPGASVEAGGLRMPTDKPAAWVGPRPDDALVLLLAGCLAERELLQHHVKEGYSEDLAIWRRGTGREGVNDRDEVSQMLGPATATAQDLVAEHREAIRRVYALFVELAPKNAQGVLPFDDALVLRKNVVRAAVLQNS